MNLQYQLSNGRWTDCNERTDEFLARAVTFAQLRDPSATQQTILELLNSGKRVTHSAGDWYANIRIQPVAQMSQPANRAGDISHEMMNTGYGKFD